MTTDTFITILSASGVVLVTIYNIVSSKHYRKAKQAQVDSLQATINSKQAEIDSLNHFTSSHVLAEYQALKSILESSIDRHKEIVAEKDKQIAEADVRQQASAGSPLSQGQGEVGVIENCTLSLTTVRNDFTMTIYYTE